MAHRTEKTETGTDIVIDGWETGIAPSPHKGTANIQNANISTELGEVTASFNRTAQLTSTGTASVAGTLTASGGDGTTVLASSTALSVGQWINVSAATVQIAKTTETVSILGVGAGGGGGGTGPGINGGGGGAGEYTLNSSLSVSAVAYTVTIGAKGTGGTTAGTNGVNGGDTTLTHISGAVITTDLSAVGGGGGAGITTTSGTAGVAGGSGGGGSGGNGSGGTHGGTTATSGLGHIGGNGSTNAGGGGGGSAAVGAAATASAGGNGGNGTASSISGASVTYAAGGGGGGNTTRGTGGSTGGGNGGQATAAGSNATGIGNGGGGASGNVGARVGGDGTDGTVIISYPTGNITATGGSMTTSGGNTIHTFTTSGTFTISSINTTQNLPAGYYYIDYSASAGLKVKIAYSYDPSGAYPIVHGTSGTVTFTTVGPLAKPVAKATEKYSTGTATLYRYYILDNTGLVWVNDTGNALGWVITNPSTTYYGTQAAPSGMAVLNGWILVFAGEKVFAKPTVDLGTAWTEIADIDMNNLYSSPIPHFAFVGHQGRCYYTDGNYIGSIFPDTSILSGTANIQSFSKYAAISTTQGRVSAILSGSGPQAPTPVGSLRIPAVFFTDDLGTMPTYLTEGVVYWIRGYDATTGNFSVYGAADLDIELTTTGSLSTGDTSATLSSSWSGATMIQPVVFSNGDVRYVSFTSGSAAISWVTGLSGSATSTITLGNVAIDTQTGAAGNQYFNTFYPIGSDASATGIDPTVTISNQRLNLPAFETAQYIAEIGNTVLIGCNGNVVYPWNQQDVTPSGIISLPEADVQNILTVNQMAYIFAGYSGNVYITDGSTASLVLSIPDYCAGVPGTPGSYIEPIYTWGDSMYLRGRVYFSVLDQTATKTGNCGGVWSFYPTQNLYYGQDTGLALRLENQNSYGTYNGVATVLLGNAQQTTGFPLYWSGWYSSVSAPVYGIDYTNSGTSATSPFIIETDAVPVGTQLTKKTFNQIEYKLGAQLDTGATVTAKYRTTLTGAWTALDTFITDTDKLSGYARVNFQQSQWLQLQFTCTPITSTADTNTYIRFKEVRIR